MAQLKIDLTTKWQTEWDNSIWGRATHDYFPVITDRIDMKWVIPSYYISQILTGHGNFKRYLTTRHLTDNGQCYCGGGPETTTHVVYHCTRFTRQRELLINKMILKGYNWPTRTIHLVNKDNYDDFIDFVIQIMTFKEREDS